jgi:ribonuclease G
MRNLWESWDELQSNIKNLKPPACVYHEPDLVERVVRDWLTEEIDRVTIDDADAFDRIRAWRQKSRRAKNVIHHYRGPALDL